MNFEFLAAKSPADWKDFLTFFLFIAAVWGLRKYFKLRKERKEQAFRDRLLASGERVLAMVVYHSHKNGRYYPKVKFQTLDGREFKHVSTAYWNAPWPAVGTKVHLVYDPSNPDSAQVVSWPPKLP